MKQDGIYLALGANLGDRQGNILRALQYIKGRCSVKAVSSFYETDPVGYEEQPKFLNAVCSVETDLLPEELLAFVKWIEKRMGRTVNFRNGPRPIDIDILMYGDMVMDSGSLIIPHPRMAERAFVLVPFAEIAEDAVHPVFGVSIGELLKKTDCSGVAAAPKNLGFPLDRDVQKESPCAPFGLGRVGVTGLERIIRLEKDGRVSLFHGVMDLFADLGAEKSGVHMSRFGEILEETAEIQSTLSAPDIETMAERMARAITCRQEALRSEVRIRAYFPLKTEAPLSGKESQEIYTFTAISACKAERCKTVSGVEAEGLTACPCAQEMMKAYSRNILISQGYSPEESAEIVDLLPAPSHNQRGRATVMIGGGKNVRAENLVHIAEASMSSEIHELLKRPDEFFVVRKAHLNPRFVEDVVREILWNVVGMFPDLPEDSFVLARQENFESIHRHNAFAERSALLGDLRREMKGQGSAEKSVTLDQWLNSWPEPL